MTWEIRQGDCLDRIAELDEASIDCVVTDPPYGIGFMGHEWDQPGIGGVANGHPQPHPSDPCSRQRTQQRASSGAGHARDRDRLKMAERNSTDHQLGRERGGAMHAGRYDLSRTANQRFQAWCEAWATELFRVLKPGGHLLAFGGCRTYHRLTSGIEDAGFEVRDQLDWLFGSGFPKSLDPLLGMRSLPRSMSRDGFRTWHRLARVMGGTALKPGHEPICVARKPLAGTVAQNLAEHGVGPLNIDACRVDVVDRDGYERNHSGLRGHEGTRSIEKRGATDLRMGGGTASAGGRWPSNAVLDENTAAELDEQSGVLVSGANPTRRGSDKFRGVYGDFAGQEDTDAPRGADVGGASRFFYCAKTSRTERNAGLGEMPTRALNWSAGEQSPGTFQAEGTNRQVANHHPTVKPIDLMRWACKLFTPPGGKVLDCFAGSGSTIVAAVLEGFDAIGIEREAEYVEIAEARIAHWASQPHQLDLLGAAA